jgi:hypothetical protein
MAADQRTGLIELSGPRRVRVLRVFKSSDTVIPYIRLFPNMPDRHPRAGCRQRRAIGVPSFLFL